MNFSVDSNLEHAWITGQTEEVETILKKSSPEDRLKFERWANVEANFRRAPFQLQLSSVKLLSQLGTQEEDSEIAELAKKLQETARERHSGIRGAFVKIWDWIDWTKLATRARSENLKETSRALFGAEENKLGRITEFYKANMHRELATTLWNLSEEQAEEVVRQNPALLEDLMKARLFNCLCILSAKLSQKTLVDTWSNPDAVAELIMRESVRGIEYLNQVLEPDNFEQVILAQRDDESDHYGENGLYAAIVHAGEEGLYAVGNRLSPQAFTEAAFALYGTDRKYETFLVATHEYDLHKLDAIGNYILSRLDSDKARDAFLSRVKDDLNTPLYYLGKVVRDTALATVVVAQHLPEIAEQMGVEIIQLIKAAKESTKH